MMSNSGAALTSVPATDELISSEDHERDRRDQAMDPEEVPSALFQSARQQSKRDQTKATLNSSPRRRAMPSSRPLEIVAPDREKPRIGRHNPVRHRSRLRPENSPLRWPFAHAGSPQRPGQASDARSRKRFGEERVDASRCDPRLEGRLDHVAGNARVLADSHGRLTCLAAKPLRTGRAHANPLSARSLQALPKNPFQSLRCRVSQIGCAALVLLFQR